MFTSTADYALRAVIYLACNPQKFLTVREIASATGAPCAYLGKVLLTLSKAGIVRSQRGFHGGFSLCQSPESLTLFDVLSKVTPFPPRFACPFGRDQSDCPCLLRHRLDKALSQVTDDFQKLTIAALLVNNEPQRVSLLLASPGKKQREGEPLSDARTGTRAS